MKIFYILICIIINTHHSFAHTITISVQNLNLSNYFENDVIDEDLDITVTASASYSCSLSSSTVTFTNTIIPSDTFVLNASLAGDCSSVNISGTLASGEYGHDYTGNLGITATYD